MIRNYSLLVFANLLVLLFCWTTAFGQVENTGKPSYVEVFRAVWEKVNENFYDPGFIGVDWEAIGEGYGRNVERVRDDVEFHALMQQMLRELPVSHLHLSRPGGSGLVGTGVRTYTIDGRSLVAFVPAGSDAQAKGVRVGDVILNSADESGPLGSVAAMRLRGCDGRTRIVNVRRESHSQPERPSIRWRTFSIGDGKRIGYIRAARFDDDTAPLVDAAMAEMRNTTGLIIDVRDNTGGNMSFVRLSSYFSEGEHLVAALLTRYYLETQGMAPKQIDPAELPKATRTYTNEAIFNAMRTNGGAVAIYSEDLGANRYKGKVAVLINEETGSAAEGFAWHMKLKSKATLIGRKTAGALLGAEYFSLPGGWRLGVPTHAGWGPDGRPVIDEPVTPNIETRWTVSDLCSGADPDMARAIEFLTKEK
ncbi:MAG TPA: S41 family peptidase [Pyrinomonadaceae bacterium]|nr:S41 family peptidase [Pyrinomonadaceae bacterium]